MITNLLKTSTEPICGQCGYPKNLVCNWCLKPICWVCDGEQMGIYIVHSESCKIKLLNYRELKNLNLNRRIQ